MGKKDVTLGIWVSRTFTTYLSIILALKHTRVTPQYGHCPGDMVVRMCKVLATPRSWYTCASVLIIGYGAISIGELVVRGTGVR